MTAPVEILLVEDNPGDARLLHETLSSATGRRCHITTVTALAQAVEAQGRQPRPDVILLDLSLPDSRGLSTLTPLLANDPSIPIVVLTGLDDDDIASAAVEAGAQDYLVKGTVTAQVMARTVRHAIDRHGLQTALRERAKEMASLYALSRELLEDLPLATMGQRVAEHLVEAMQWPVRCQALVTLDGVSATSGALARDGSALSRAITVNGEERGRLSVWCHTPARSFLAEEQQVLDSAAEAVAGWLRRQDAIHRLAHDEERLRTMVAHLPGMIWTTDTHLRATSCAGSALVTAGIDEERHLGSPIIEVWDDTAVEVVEPRLTAALAGEASVLEHPWRDRWWRTYLEPKRDPGGDLEGIVCLSLDITQELEHQQELDTARQRMQGLFDHASDAMLLADDDGTYLDANPAACSLTGYRVDELVGRHAWDLTPERGTGPTQDEALELWRQFVTDGTMAGEFPVRRKDATTVHTEFRAVADIVPGVHLSILRDITERQQAEQALAASEAQFRFLAESAQDAIYRIRLEPEVALEYINPAVETISGFPLQAWYDDPMLYLERLHPDDLQPIDEITDDVTAVVQKRFRRADGTWIWIEDRRTIVNEAGRPTVVQGIIRDITARHETEQALRNAIGTQSEALERLRAVDDLKSSFLKAISHELRTPLTSVLGYTRTLCDRADQLTAEQVADFHQRLATNATRLDRLVTDLLDVDRLNRGAVRLDLMPTDLRSLVIDIARNADFEGRNCVIDEERAVAVIDARKIERIVHNLLSNAVKHTPSGSTVWIRCQNTPEAATITISDDGPGVPESDRDHIFEPFWQGQAMESSASPGTGIGLALVRQIAAIHGGRVGFAPRRGGGATFTLSLPNTHPASPAPNTTGPLVVSAVPVDHEGAIGFRELVQDTLDQLHATTDPAEASGLLLTFIQRAGGEVTAADGHDRDLIDLDLSLDTPQLLRAAAPPGSSTRRRLENHLPFLLQRARQRMALAPPPKSRNGPELQTTNGSRPDLVTSGVRTVPRPT